MDAFVDDTGVSQHHDVYPTKICDILLGEFYSDVSASFCIHRFQSMATSKERNRFLEELWARHVPDKNTYNRTASGRTVVTRRVFQRLTAPAWAFYDCRYCVDPDAVCHRHQFVLFGYDGIRRYVEAWERGRFQNRTPSSMDVTETQDETGLMDCLRLEETPDELFRAETADRVDVMDAYNEALRAMWWEFRRCRGDIFYRDTGVYLPPVVRFPQSNLYRAFRESHHHSQS